jgi:hypothetical protein
MATMVTVDDIETLYGQTLTTAERAEVEMYIGFAIGEVEAYLGRPVTATTVEDEKILPDADGACYFKITPVIGPSVSALTINGQVIADPENFITVTPWGIDNIWEQTLEIPTLETNTIDRVGYYGAEVLVSYTGGLDFPEAIKGLVTRGVLRKYAESAGNRLRNSQGHAGLKKIQVEDYMIEYERPLASSRSSGTSAITIFESETDFWSIKRYKKRQVRR